MAVLSIVISALVELAAQAPAEHAWDAARRREGVIRTLKRLKLDPDRPPADFDGLYAYTLVEWGAYKPAPVLEFFRHEFVRDAFRRAFYEANPALLAQEAEGVIDWSRETGRLGRLEYDPRREFAAFSAVFNRLLDYARTPAEARREQRLVALQQALADIQAQLAAQPSLADLRALAQSPPPAAPAPDDADLLRSYLALAARRAARLPLAPLDPAGRESAHLQLAQLFINLEAGEATTPFQGGRPNSGVYTAALGHIHAQPQLILLGDPGSGKSTLLRFLALCLAQARLEPDGDWLDKLAWPVRLRTERVALDIWSERQTGKLEADEIEQRHWVLGPLIPIFLALRDFARTSFDPRDELALWRFVCASLEREGLADAIPALQRAAGRGQLLWLLDGVDEVPPAQRRAVWQAIGAMCAGPYGGNRWVATCRQLSFDRAELPVAGWPEQLLRPLSEDDSAAFIARWYAALAAGGELSAAQAEDKTRRLQQAIQRPGLQPLARNPMLLTIMALVQTYHGTLPEERARLYQACVETLLLRWQRHKELDPAGQLPDGLAGLGVKQDDLERLLAEIAWEAQRLAPEREEAADIPEADVIRLATQHLGSYARAEAFVDYTEQRAHLLLGKGGLTQRLFSFPHRTFQEYLAACHLAGQRRFAHRAAELAAQGDIWREVLNLAAGTLTFNQRNREKALDAVAQVLPDAAPAPDDRAGWQRVWLAGEMAAVVGAAAMEQDEIGRELLPRLHAAVVALIAQAAGLTPPQRAAAAEALDRLGWLPPDLHAWRLCPGCGAHGQDLLVARYPVTNYQFSLFIAADGYTTRSYWSADGWRWRTQEHADYRGAEPVTEPENWRDERYGRERRGYPVVGVSWYEAQAYCAWLSALLDRRRAGETLPPEQDALAAGLAAGDGGAVRLPTDDEWVKAAGGKDNDRYPWDAPGGPVTDSRDAATITARANVEETGIGRTTPVALFPLGASRPHDLMDLAGNVWEWTQENSLRGGSWDAYMDRASVSARSHFNPSSSIYYLGFRVVSPVLLAAGS